LLQLLGFLLPPICEHNSHISPREPLRKVDCLLVKVISLNKGTESQRHAFLLRLLKSAELILLIFLEIKILVKFQQII
jgi:hypothetical protein